jgi:ribonuclease BN (tRNA processing enzyme)
MTSRQSGPDDRADLTFVGNATVLLRLGPFTLLTDPNFLHAGQRAYLGYGLVSKRLRDPAMQVAELPPLDLVLLSHLHGDHFGGVPLLLLDALFHRPRSEPLVVAGPRGCGARVFEAFDVLFPGTLDETAAHRVVHFVEFEPYRAVTFDDVTVTPVPVRHSRHIECFALRVELSGRVVTYSGDTEWTPSLPEAARDADLFICECFAFDRRVPGHLSHAVLEDHAAELTAARIVLTHAGPDMLERRDAARWPVADDGLLIEV